MKILPREDKHLRLWFSNLNALIEFRREYLEIVKNVHTDFQKYLLNNQKGYIFTVSLKEKNE